MAKKPEDENPVLKEVAALGKEIQKALSAAASSKELRDLGSEIAQSFHKVGEKVVTALKAAKQSEESQVLKRQIKKVVSAGKESGKAKAAQVRQNLSTRLRSVGGELSKLAEKIEARLERGAGDEDS